MRIFVSSGSVLNRSVPVAMAVLLLACVGARGADSTWIEPDGGFFSDTLNWSYGVPGAGDTATFDEDATYTVEFLGSPETGALVLQDGVVTFQIAYGATAYTYQSGVVSAGTASGEAATMIVNAGTLNAGTSGISRFGETGGSSGTLRLTGDGTTWSSTGSHNLYIGEHGFGKLVVENKATMNVYRLWPSYQASGTSEVDIQGDGTELNVSNNFFVSRRGNSEVTVSDGADVSVGGSLYLSDANKASMTVDAAAVSVSGGLFVAREAIGTPAEGELYIKNGGSVTAGYGRIATQTNARRQAVGTVEVSGNESLLTINGSTILGQRSGTGDTGWHTSSNTGTLRVLDGGEVRSGQNSVLYVHVGSGINAEGGQGIGVLEISGAGSRYQVGNASYASYVIIGHDGGKGTVTVADGGELDVAGSVTVQGDGALHIASGSVGASDLVFATDGLLHVTLSDQDTAPLITLESEFDPGEADFELKLAGGFSAALNEEFTIAAYDLWSDAAFADLGQGSFIDTPEGYEFEVAYGAEAMTLTVAVIPEPGTAWLLLAGASGLILRRRRITRRVARP